MSDRTHNGGLPPRRLVAVPDERRAQELLWVDVRDPLGGLRLRDDLTSAALGASIMLANARLFLEQLAPGGVPATAKGNLSRAFVLAMYERMRFSDHQNEWRRYVKVTKEDDVRPLHILRVVLTVGGLIRKYRGRFVTTKRGAALAAESSAGALQAHLFRTFFGTFNLGYLGAYDDPYLQSTVAYTLYMLRQMDDGWFAPEDVRRIGHLGLSFMAETDQTEERRREWSFESRIIRPLEEFGLLETRVCAPPEAPQWERKFEVRKTSLFDAFIGFDLDGDSATEPATRPPRAARKPPGLVHQLRISLKGVKPPIWRRVCVDGDITLRKLHNVIQAACGWSNSHLHEFEVGGERFGRTDPEWPSDMRSDTRRRLSSLGLSAGSSLTYVYDFGDWWEHTVLVEAVRPPAEGEVVPRCTAGRRAFPPEDCGGPWAYADLLAVLADPADPEHEQMKEWVGPYFDPEAVDLDEIDRELALVAKGREPGIGWH